MWSQVHRGVQILRALSNPFPNLASSANSTIEEALIALQNLWLTLGKGTRNSLRIVYWRPGGVLETANHITLDSQADAVLI